MTSAMLISPLPCGTWVECQGPAAVLSFLTRWPYIFSGLHWNESSLRVQPREFVTPAQALKNTTGVLTNLPKPPSLQRHALRVLKCMTWDTERSLKTNHFLKQSGDWVSFIFHTKLQTIMMVEQYTNCHISDRHCFHFTNETFPHMEKEMRQDLNNPLPPPSANILALSAAPLCLLNRLLQLCPQVPFIPTEHLQSKQSHLLSPPCL